MSIVLRVATAAALVAGAALNGSRRRLVRHFARARAVTEAAATELPGARPFQAMWVAHLRTHLVLRSAAAGRWWLDERAWAAYRRIRRRRVLVAAAAVLALSGAWWVSQAGGTH